MKPTNVFLALAVAAAVCTAPAGKAAVQFPATNTGANPAGPGLDGFLTDKAVAKGRGFEIKRSELDRTMLNAKANAGAAGKRLSPSELSSLEIETLDNLILLRMLNDRATPEQKAQGKQSAEKAYKEFRERAQNEAEFLSRLKAVGLTEENFRVGLAEEKTAHYVMVGRVKVTEEQVKKFYDENPTASEVPEQALIAFIRLGGPDAQTGAPPSDEVKQAKKKQLEDLRERAVKGEDFSKLAVEYSEHPQAKQFGGELRLMRGLRQTPPEFEAAAFALKTNEISPVISLENGFHLIKLKEKLPAKKDSLGEIAPRIRDYLENREIEGLLHETYLELKQDYNVEILDAKLQLLEEIKGAIREKEKTAAPGGDKPKEAGK